MISSNFWTFIEKINFKLQFHENNLKEKHLQKLSNPIAKQVSHAIIQLNKRKYNGNDDKDNPTISDEITMPQPRNKPAMYPGLALKAKRFNAFEQGDDESL